MKIKSLSEPTIFEETSAVLSAGGLVVFPSDTVYGLLVDATDEKAVQKLIAFKNRAPGKAISVFVRDMNMMEEIAEIPTERELLLQKLLPGPYTLVFDSTHKTSHKLESEKGTIGVRHPDYAPVQKLMNLYKKPVTATSANLGGRHPHYSVESLLNQLPQEKQEMIDLIVDAGKLPRNKPSSVIDLRSDKVEILRHGDIVFEKEDEYVSTSPKQTRELGKVLLDQSLRLAQGKPIVFILKGDLGTGKTEMTRGIAGKLGIEKVVSPTFVIYYEYELDTEEFPISNIQYPERNYHLPPTTYSLFVHADLYNIEDPEEFQHLGFTEYLDKKSIMVIEWGERMGKLYDTFKQKAEVVFVELEHVDENMRKIRVKR